MRGFTFSNGNCVTGQNRTCVQSCLHLHDTNASFCIAGHNRTVDGRRAAPTRQKARMDIQTPFYWGIQNRLRQDQAIGHDHCYISIQCLKFSQRLVRSHSYRIAHSQAQRFGFGLNGAWAIFLTPPSWAWGLGINRDNVVTTIDQRLKNWDRKIGRPHKDYSHITLALARHRLT
jgi:hypothetical protein